MELLEYTGILYEDRDDLMVMLQQKEQWCAKVKHQICRVFGGTLWLTIRAGRYIYIYIFFLAVVRSRLHTRGGVVFCFLFYYDMSIPRSTQIRWLQLQFRCEVRFLLTQSCFSKIARHAEKFSALVLFDGWT